MQLYDLATGRRVLACLDELNRSQWLSSDALLGLQRRKLHKLLAYAYRHVPYYRRTFDQVGFQPDEVLEDMSSLHKLPILTKATIREHLDELQTTESKRREQLSRLTTGGSTGQPLVFMQDST